MAGQGRRDGAVQQAGPAPPPSSTGPPKARIVSEGRGTVQARCGPSSRGASLGHEEARRTPRRGGNRGPPGLTIFYYPTVRGPNTKGAQTPAKARLMGVCFVEPPRHEAPRTPYSRSPQNTPSTRSSE